MRSAHRFIPYGKLSSNLEVSFTVGYVWIYANLWSKPKLLLVSYMDQLFSKSAPTEHRSCLTLCGT
jgi:hypothetical protein